MGQYFLVVNTDKKQFIDAWKFGEGVAYLQAVSGYHAQAVALLTCRMDQVRGTEGNLLGSWSGDNVIVAAEYSLTGNDGVERNLYKTARDEFEDISYKALAMLCATHEPVCWELAEKASTRRHERLIFHLGNAISEAGSGSLEQALNEVIGAEWKDRYKAAAEHYAAPV
jgi:hypothetical protein